MTNQSHPSPDPWALNKRIAAEWQEAGRDGAGRATQMARVQAARARRAAAMSESRIKAAVDRAVREALASPEFAEAVDQYAQAAAPVPVPLPVPDKALHEMTAEEWDAHRRTYWQAVLPDHSRTLTISDLIGSDGGDGA